MKSLPHTLSVVKFRCGSVATKYVSLQRVQSKRALHCWRTAAARRTMECSKTVLACSDRQIQTTRSVRICTGSRAFLHAECAQMPRHVVGEIDTNAHTPNTHRRTHACISNVLITSVNTARVVLTNVDLTEVVLTNVNIAHVVVPDVKRSVQRSTRRSVQHCNIVVIFSFSGKRDGCLNCAPLSFFLLFK